MQLLPTEDPLAIAVTHAIQSGDVDALRKLLAENPGLATVCLGGDAAVDPCAKSRTLLHVATDWPGHFPNGPAIVAALVEAGADVNGRFAGPHTETPLHWAASSDDVPVLDALLDLGADIEATGAVIGGGTPIADAAAFGQWNAARRLIERGAKTSLWEAAALGLLDRVEAHFAGVALKPWTPGAPTSTGAAPDETTHAFWCACHGGQLAVARYLCARGADINWIGYNDLTSLGAAKRTGAPELVAWLVDRGGKSTAEVRAGQPGR